MVAIFYLLVHTTSSFIATPIPRYTQQRVRPTINALLSPGTSSSSPGPLGRRTASGRRTEWDGSLAGEGSAAAALIRDARGRALPRPPAVVLDVIDTAFYSEYDAIEINALWAQVRKCYGTEERAIEAVTRQPYVLNPTYTWPPPLLSRSKDALVQVLGSEEDALEVMLKNPAVLQCGAPGILELGGDEIKLFANLRYLGSTLSPRLTGAIGVSLLLLILLTIAGGAVDGEAREAFAPLLGISKPCASPLA